MARELIMTRKLLRKSLPLLLGAVVAVTAWATLPSDTSFRFDPVLSTTTKDIIRNLEKYHYRKAPLDDIMSSRVLDSFLERLDGSRSYFLASDIAEFEGFRYQLDDDLKRGRLDTAAQIYDRYQQRVEARLSYLVENLPTMLATMDFTQDESLVIERDQLPWPSTPQEADELWRKQIKASALSMKLAGKDMAGIEDLLLRRYGNQLQRVRQINEEDVYQLFINSFTELYDPHTNYFSPRTTENFNIQMRLSLDGIGAVLQQDEEYTKVVRLVPAGPADKQGELRPADRIIGVGQGASGPIEDVIGWRLDEVVDKIRGPRDTVVRLQVLPADAPEGEIELISIVRNRVRLEEQAASSKVLDLWHEGELRRIGVIDIPAFYEDFEAMRRGDPNFRSTTRDTRRLLRDLVENEQVDGVIVDLRNNGGGSLREAEQLTSLFLESGFTVQIRHSDSKIERHGKNQPGRYYSGPMLVMINRLSASASEIFAGAIQDHQRGLVVGSQSFGKGTVQTLTPLSHGQLKLTQSKFYRISGDSTQHRGIVPDITFPHTYDPDRVGESALDNALPWDRIRPISYSPFQDLRGLLPLLRERHQDRVESDPDFIYLQDQLALSEVFDDRTVVSLNEAERLAERAARREAQLAIENRLRHAKGMEPLASLDDESPPAEPDIAADPSAAPAEDPAAGDDIAAIDPDDVLLTEAGLILLDSIHFGQRLATREPVSVSLR